MISVDTFTYFKLFNNLEEIKEYYFREGIYYFDGNIIYYDALVKPQSFPVAEIDPECIYEECGCRVYKSRWLTRENIDEYVSRFSGISGETLYYKSKFFAELNEIKWMMNKDAKQ